MKFLILAALVAVATADYHDDTFHFAALDGVSGLQKTAFVQAATPVLAKKYASAPVYSSFVQPAYGQQYVKQVAAPVLFKSIEQEIPAYSQQYVKEIAQPIYSQQYYAKQLAQPLYSQQYYAKELAQPLYSQQYYAKQLAQPLYSQQYYAKDLAQPLYSQQYYAKELAQPVYSQQYSTLKKVAQPVYSQYSTLKKVAEPAVFAKSVIAKPIVAQPYSALSGISTYAAAYNGPQFRILAQTQEADPAGPYKTSFATENGIQATEEGSLVAGSEGAVVAAQGSYSYTGPDGQVYTVNYIADENGFRAAGDHLPTPPPIPAEILKSLEENARSGEQYDDQGRLIYKH